MGGAIKHEPAAGSRLGLDSARARAWAMYDWANSAFQCTIITAVFPVYYGTSPQQASPAPRPPRASRRRPRSRSPSSHWLRRCSAPTPIRRREEADAGGVHGASASCNGRNGLHRQRGLAAAPWLFVIANVGISGSFVFYDSLLPHIAADDEMDQVSSAGYALGYLGGGMLLADQPALDHAAPLVRAARSRPWHRASRS